MVATDKVLIVDDDANVLKAYERRLRKRFQLDTALCSEEGVTAVNILGPFAVVVSDMQMPRENGVQFLQRILEADPNCVRIMLTGNADQATAAAAINQGQVFRFLNKPCEAEDLSRAISDGIEEHKRRVAEKKLLRETVFGAIEMLAKVLSVSKPQPFGRADCLRSLVRELSKSQQFDEPWQVEAAALLSQLGWVSIPDNVIAKLGDGVALTAREQEMVDNRHETAGELIDEVPRLNRVARIVRLVGTPLANPKSFHPSDLDRKASELIRLGEAYVELTLGQGLQPMVAVTRLELSDSAHPQELVNCLREHLEALGEHALASLAIDELEEGMRLAEDVVTTDGAMLVAKGQEVTAALRKQLRNYSLTHDVQQPILVLLIAEQPRVAG